MKKLSEVAKLVGLLRQRIQEYEKVGIAFKPKVKIVMEIGCTVKPKSKGCGRSSFI